MIEVGSQESSTRPPFRCPSCGSVLDVTDCQDEITCTVCNAHFAPAGHLCPACGAYHDEDLAACQTCGTPLVRLCWHCQTANWTGNDICTKCGERIDLLSQLEAKSSQTTPARLSRQMSAARQLNEAESEASSRRMAELMAIEEARQAELHRQRARQKRQERNMLMVVFVAVVIFLIALLAFALVSAIA